MAHCLLHIAYCLLPMGWLLYSKEMLILWDPNYLSRKWCVFELASFLAAPGPPATVMGNRE